MSREQILKIARDECLMRGYMPKGLTAVDIGPGWLLVTHTHGQWLVVL